jgi:putative addiction module component (TIGR02574 family)
VREYAAMVQLPESAILDSESNVNMDTTAILTEIGKLPVEDQIVLVQQVWDAIADSDTPLDLTDAQKAEISRRSAELDANPDHRKNDR